MTARRAARAVTIVAVAGVMIVMLVVYAWLAGEPDDFGPIAARYDKPSRTLALTVGACPDGQEARVFVEIARADHDDDAVVVFDRVLTFESGILLVSDIAPLDDGQWLWVNVVGESSTKAIDIEPGELDLPNGVDDSGPLDAGEFESAARAACAA